MTTKSVAESTLVCLIAEQDLLSMQVLNSTVLPGRFLFSAYLVAKKQVGLVKNLKIVKRSCSAIWQMSVGIFFVAYEIFEKFKFCFANY